LESRVVLSAYSPSSAVFHRLKEAKRMVWHAERKEAVLNDPTRSERVILTHPSDASQWKALDSEYQDFGDEPRNIRLGVSTDTRRQ
jgi:hypothetical protein